MKFRRQMLANYKTESPSYFLALQASDQAERSRPRSSKWVHRFSEVVAIRWRMEKGEITRQSVEVFTSLPEFWKSFYASLTAERPLWAWCHDLTYHASILDLWKELDKGRLVHRTACFTARVGYVSLQRDDCRCVWLDRQNWWKDGLPPANNQAIRAERIRDQVADLWRFLRRHDLGVMRVTASGQSLQAYRHRFGIKVKENHVPLKGKNKGKVVPRWIVLPKQHNHQRALGYESEALLGGPVHCWFIGRPGESVDVFDVQSLYPAVMQSNAFPARLAAYQEPEGKRPELLPDYGRNCIASVELDTDRPLFPFRKDGRTIYPVGRFTTTLAGPELKVAHQLGYLRKCFAFQEYEMRTLFSDYVEYFWNLRARDNTCDHWKQWDFIKIFLVALHGKFGQRSNQWEESPKVPPAKRWGYWPDVAADDKKVFWRRSIAGKVQTSCPEGWADHSFPAISAFVYSYARVWMNELFDVARTGRLYYSAIDSVHCSARSAELLRAAGLVQPGQLGRLRHVGTWSGVEYFGPHDYIHDGIRVQNGTPAGAKTLSNGDLAWVDHEPASKILERGPDGSLVSEQIRIRRTRASYGGIVGADGWVKPFREG